MTSREIPRRIEQDVSIQRIGTEMLAYDGRRHLAFCMNASSAAVWRLADGTREIAQISEAASLELGVEVSDDLVRFIVEALRGDGLIEPMEADVAGVETASRISRRAMLQRLGTGGAMLLPVVVSIMAPTAAQAYNGCVDCSVSSGARAARIRKLQQSGDTPSGNPQQ
jgi:hypothetical protein